MGAKTPSANVISKGVLRDRGGIGVSRTWAAKELQSANLVRMQRRAKLGKSP